MPCNCDHLESNNRERELSKIACLLDELDGKKEIDPHHWDGYHPRVYSRWMNQAAANEMIKTLCDKLQSIDVTKQSLEMQIWWRDHQKDDEERIKKQLEVADNENKKKAAIAKLTPHERKLLNL